MFLCGLNIFRHGTQRKGRQGVAFQASKGRKQKEGEEEEEENERAITPQPVMPVVDAEGMDTGSNREEEDEPDDDEVTGNFFKREIQWGQQGRPPPRGLASSFPARLVRARVVPGLERDRSWGAPSSWGDFPHHKVESLHLSLWPLSDSRVRRQAFHKELRSSQQMPSGNPLEILTIPDWLLSESGVPRSLAIPLQPLCCEFSHFYSFACGPGQTEINHQKRKKKRISDYPQTIISTV